MDEFQNSGTEASQNQNPSADQGANDQQTQQPNLGQIRRAGEQSVLQVLSKVSGQQFSNTRDAAAFVESLLNAGSNTQASGGASDQPKSDNRHNRANSEMTELRGMITALQDQLKSKDEAVKRTTLQSQIKEVAVRSGFDPNMLDIATNLFESQIAFDDAGDYYVRGANGEIRLDEQGNPYSLENLARDILKQRPKLAVDMAPQGTGTKFGFGVKTSSPDGIPDASQDIEAWKRWKQSQGVGGRSLKGVSVSVNKPLI